MAARKPDPEVSERRCPAQVLIDVYSGLGLRVGEGPDAARRAEAAGFSALWTIEAAREPFLPLALAAEHTERLELGTAVAVAFARNPMVLAHAAHELNDYAHGRLLLGIGSQVRGHIERRFSSPWSRPAARMREFILAMRAIWSCWNEGTRLCFDGEFYRHTLMTPMFDPGPSSAGPPRVLLAAVGTKMTGVAAGVADGLIAHPLTSVRYLREVTLPTVGAGLDAGGRRRDTFTVALPVMVATGRDDEEMATAERAVRQQIAFYASTPAYKTVLDLHGWSAIGERLTGLSKAGEWDAMAAEVDDDMVETFAVVASPAKVVPELEARFSGLVDRVSLYAPYPVAAGMWETTLAEAAASRGPGTPGTTGAPGKRGPGGGDLDER